MTKIKVKEVIRTERKIIRIVSKDGSVREEITEHIKENRRSSSVKKISPTKKWHARISTNVLKPNSYEIGLGKEIFTNLSWELSYNNDSQGLYLGLLLRF